MVETSNRVSGTVEEHELRSVAQLRMLHALATRLNALDDVDAIGEAITTELRTSIDYHNCRIYLLQRRWDHAVADDVPRRPDRVQVRDARGVGHPGRRGDHRLCGELGRDVLRARRPPRRAGMADRRDRRDRRVAPGRSAESGRQGDRRHRALEPRDRSVRRGGPACARGAGLARRGRLREREPAPEGTRGREDLVRTARALAGAQWGRRRLQRPRPSRDRDPVDHRWLGRRGVPPRPEDR